MEILQLKQVLQYPKLQFIPNCDLEEIFYCEDFYDKELFSQNSIWTFAGYADSDLYIPMGDGDIDCIFRNGSTYISAPLHYFKPVLRNLSDLTKEIEVNGEKFVPLIFLNNMNSFGEHLFIQDGLTSKNLGKLDWWTESENGFYFHEMQNCYEKLFEWHFNVFNLPKHLWVDINTLDNG